MRAKKTRKESAITPIGKASSGKFGNSRHPVYGYARDRFGRVQERDSLNEDRKNEFLRLATLRDTLLPKLMSGEIKVGDVK